MASYMDYHYERSTGEKMFGDASVDLRAYPYHRHDTDGTLIDEYYDMPVSLHSDHDSFSSSFHQESEYLTPASSVGSSRGPAKEDSPSMSEMHRYLRGNYNHVAPLNAGSPSRPRMEPLNTSLPPATAEEEEEMTITPLDRGIRDHDFARGRKASVSNQQRYQARITQPSYNTHQLQQLREEEQHRQQQQPLAQPSSNQYDQPHPSPAFHNRVTANFDPIRDSASPRNSILSGRSIDANTNRYSIMSMQQAALEPPMPTRPAKWFERETSASFQLRLAPRGMGAAKPTSASSATSSASSSDSAAGSRTDDWEFPVLSDDPLALSRLLISALFTMQDVPSSGEGSKQHALALVPARTSGARHFAMKQVKGDPLAGGKTGEEGEKKQKEEEVVVIKAPEAKKIMWRIRFKAIA